MSVLWATAWREFASFFRLPVGWALIALHLLLAGAVFAGGTLRPGEPASMRLFFTLENWLLIFLAPAISMRLFAEEQRSGTIEPLTASPAPDWAVVLGKHAGSAMFLVAMFAPTLVYVVVLESVSDPDVRAIGLGYLGLVLLGGLYLAVGALFSSMTASQPVAFLATLFALLLVQLLSGRLAGLIGAPYDRFLYALSVELRLADFGKGILDSAHVVFFLGATGWLLALTTLWFGARRWR